MTASLLTRLSSKVLAAALSLLVLAGSAIHAQDNVPASRRLPPGVLAYFRVTDVSQLKSQFLKTGYGQLWQDESLKPFKEQFHPKLEEFSSQVEEATGASLDEILNLISGEFSVAFIRSSSKGVGPVALANVKSRSDLLQSLLAKLETQLVDGGAVKSSSNYSDTEITTFQFPAEDQKSKPMNFCYFLKDGYWVTGSTAGHLELVLDRWDGTSTETFAGDSNFQYVMNTCLEKVSNAPVVEWYLTPVELTLTTLSLIPETASVTGFAAGMLPALGLNKLKAYGGTTHLATEKYDSVTMTVMCVDPPSRAVLNLFQFPASIKGPPAWVPPAAASYVGFQWDLQKAYEGAKQLIDGYLGPGSTERSVKQLADAPSGLGLNIKTDIIDQFTGETHFYSAVAEGDQLVPQFAVSIGVNDSEKISAVIKSVLGKIGTGSEYRTEEVAGTTVYLPPAGSDVQVAIATKGKQLVIASGIPVLEAVLNGSSNAQTLAGSAAYQKAAENFPPLASILSYSNVGQAMKTGYEAVRSGKVDALSEGEIDFSLLPPYEAISKYLQPSGSYMVPTDRGAFGMQFTPKYQP